MSRKLPYRRRQEMGAKLMVEALSLSTKAALCQEDTRAANWKYIYQESLYGAGYKICRSTVFSNDGLKCIYKLFFGIYCIHITVKGKVK